jgi:uncharacterized protein (DUF1810 family)
MASVDLERFRHAQDAGYRTFAMALDEIQSGGKQSHWIWYVFPQLDGLGTSVNARRYAIRDLAEAEAYLRDPVLGPRLTTITRAVVDQLRRGADLETLMASQIDALKLVSSLTLFAAAADALATSAHANEHREFLGLAREALTIAEAQGFSRCQRTLDTIRLRS